MTQPISQTQIYLSKRLRVTVPAGRGGAAPALVATAVKNLQALGFGLKAPLLERLKSQSDTEVIEGYNSGLPVL